MSITKEQVLKDLDKVKEFVSEIENKKEEKKVGIEIKNIFSGSIIFSSTKTTFRESVEEAIGSGANLCNADLRDADLRDANLCNADLRDADLCNADLRDANLCNADLRDANLCDANLCNADLRDADLSGANLRDANLCNADLCNAELQNARFYGRGGSEVIKKANLEGFLGALGFKLED